MKQLKHPVAWSRHMLLLSAAIFLSAAPVHGEAAPADKATLAAFQVSDGRTFELPGTTRGVAAFSIVAPIDGASREIILAPQSVRGENYKVLVAAGDGSYAQITPGPSRTLRGTVAGDADSAVAASLLPEGLFARIILGNSREFWIEPVASKLPTAPAGMHIIYATEDSIAEVPAACASDANSLAAARPTPAHHDEALRGACTDPACVVGTCLAEIAFDTDVEFNNRYGAGAEDRINLILDTVNIQYERDVDISMRISTIILRTAEPDPYNTASAGTLLSQFKTQWQSFHQSEPRDIAHMLAGRLFDENYIGASHNSSVCSDIFTGLGYSVVETDYNNSWPHATDVTAHELGHNWGADHCDCYVANQPATWWTMNPGITGANRFHPTFTIPEIAAFRDSIECLEPLIPPQDTTTPLPIHETFSSTTLDPVRWTLILGPEVNELGVGEPSGPYALNLNGNSIGGDQITTGVIDLTGIELNTLVVEYDWQQKGGGDNPEGGDNLWLEYLDFEGFWNPLDIKFRTAAPAMSFAHQVIDWLPEEQYHAGFRLRFRLRESFESCNDDWFIDNFHVYSSSATESCSDGVLNQGETRIDCGGPCAACACTSDGACENGNPCDGTSTCNASGQCVAGTPPTCNDGDPCTTDSCQAGVGCQFESGACGGACCSGGACSFVESAAACQGFVCNVADHLPGSFTGCFGDADGNGFVNAGDRGFVAVNIGATAPELLCVFDIDGNGFVNAGDRGFVAVNIGLCSPLPDYQNGSGLNQGVPDARFAPAAFQGAGTTCAGVTCP